MDAILAQMTLVEMKMERDDMFGLQTVTKMIVDDGDGMIIINGDVTRYECADEDTWHIL